jgi:hypothetical protein
LDPGALVARIRHETDTDLGDREWEGVMHCTRAIARLYRTIEQDIVLRAPEIRDPGLKDSSASRSVRPGSNLGEDEPPKVSAYFIFLRESLSHLLVELVEDTGQIWTAFPGIQVRRVLKRLSIAGEKVICLKQLRRRQRAGRNRGRIGRDLPWRCAFVTLRGIVVHYRLLSVSLMSTRNDTGRRWFMVRKTLSKA